jgi:DNA-binding response OmpR family regulator
VTATATTDIEPSMRTTPTDLTVAACVGVRVLIAADDSAIRRMTATALSRVGFQVLLADDVKPALVLAESGKPDLALIDLHMSSSGLAVVRRLKQLYGDAVWVTVFSGEDGDEARDACFAAGANDVIAKPAPSAELRRRMIAAASAQQAIVRR